MRQDDDRTQINRQMAKMKKKDRDFFVTIFFTMKLCRLFRDNKMFTIFDCQFSISHEAKRCSIFDFLVSFFLWFLWISRWDIISTWNSQVTCKLFGCISFFRNVNNFRKGSTNLFQLIPLKLQLRMIVVKLFFFVFFTPFTCIPYWSNKKLDRTARKQLFQTQHVHVCTVWSWCLLDKLFKLFV